MINRSRRWEGCCTVLVSCMLCAIVQVHAQQRGTAGGGRTAGQGRSGSSGSTREYYGNGQVGDAMITSDPETRRLIVITDDETSQYIGQVITNLDRPRPQVLIKVVFLEVTYRNGSDIGVEGSFQHNINSTTIGSLSNIFGLGSQGGAPLPPYTSMTGAGLYQVFGSDFQATLRAIAEAGKLEVLSRPAILARNSQQASITVGQQVPLITNTRFDTFGNQINSVTYRDIGIILLVTPFITSDGLIEMILAPQISTLSDQTIPISNGGSGGAPIGAPIINIRSADTVVVTPDGQTVVIGGLMQNAKTQTEMKIPLLGDIPLLGILFKRKLKLDVKTELLIFLTPHIVAEPTQLAGTSARERHDTTLLPKAFPEEELDRFLKDVPSRENPPPTKNRK